MADRKDMQSKTGKGGFDFMRTILSVSGELDVVDRNFMIADDRKMSFDWVLSILETACSFLKRVSASHEPTGGLDPAFLVAELLSRRHPLFKESVQDFMSHLFGDEEEPLSVPIQNIAQYFFQLKWDQIYRVELMSVIRARIDSQVLAVCEGEYEEPKLPELKEWLSEVMIPLVSPFFAEDTTDQLLELLYMVRSSLSFTFLAYEYLYMCAFALKCLFAVVRKIAGGRIVRHDRGPGWHAGYIGAEGSPRLRPAGIQHREVLSLDCAAPPSQARRIYIADIGNVRIACLKCSPWMTAPVFTYFIVH